MRKKNTNVKKLVLAALFIAIIIVMTAVPYTGYIEYVPGGINMTTLHIPVIIGAVFLGWKYGALLGCVWGVTCVVKAFLTPGPGNVPFQNPMISVLPRIIVGIVAGLVFALVSGRFGKKPVVAGTHPKRSREIVAAAVAAAAGTLTNTVLVLTMLHFYGAPAHRQRNTMVIHQAIHRNHICHKLYRGGLFLQLKALRPFPESRMLPYDMCHPLL